MMTTQVLTSFSKSQAMKELPKQNAIGLFLLFVISQYCKQTKK